MARIVVIGGGVLGLTTAMLLARDNNDVTVLERDPAPPPDSVDDAWYEWERRGVNQFRMIHMFLPRFRELLEAELPDAVREFDDLGAIRYNAFEGIPDALTGGSQPGDERFTALTARRPVGETALARAAAKTANLEVRRGVAVAGLTTGDGNGVPHVTGVRTESGDELAADLVIDAAGRRSSLPAMLAAVGARDAEEELEDCGFMYYARHFRSPDREMPPLMCGLLTPWGTVSSLTLPADNGSWGLGLITSAKDAELRALKDVDVWMRVWHSLPLVVHWADAEPVDGGRVAIMAKIEDRCRNFVVDGAPVATGVLPVGDSWACTNPSLGRGMSIGFIHAVALRDYLRDAALDDAAGVAKGWHDVTQNTVDVWYRETLAFDRHRLAEIDADIAGKPYEPDDPEWEMLKALQHASGQDGGALRAMLRIASVLETGSEVFADASMFEKVVTLGAGWRDAPSLAPSREELVATVRGA